MHVNALKDAIIQEVDTIRSLLIETSDWMAQNPEIGLQEYQASMRLTDILGKFGLQVERGIAGLPTAFMATIPGSHPRPKIAIIAEYDALPEIGHGCGHNIIAAASLGAGIVLAKLKDLLPGSITILGTPAEESTVSNAGGKIPIIKYGFFNDIDAAIMIHPLTEDRIAGEPTLVAHGLDFHFYGQSAHAAMNPHEGINALDAVISMFNNIGLLRQQTHPDVRIHGIITHGGVAPNVIPDYAACRFRVRATNPVVAIEAVERVIGCAKGAAIATMTTMKHEEYAPPYLNMIPNEQVGAVLQHNFERVGRILASYSAPCSPWSTDFGNISHIVPSAFAYLSICEKNIGWHTREVAAATQTSRGHDAIIAGAKGLAMAAVDMLCDPSLCRKAKEEHESRL